MPQLPRRGHVLDRPKTGNAVSIQVPALRFKMSGVYVLHALYLRRSLLWHSAGRACCWPWGDDTRFDSPLARGATLRCDVDCSRNVDVPIHQTARQVRAHAHWRTWNGAADPVKIKWSADWRPHGRSLKEQLHNLRPTGA